MRSHGLGVRLARGVPGWEPPSDARSVEAVLAPFRSLSPDQRLAWQAELVRSLVALAGNRLERRDDDSDALWRVWKGPPGPFRPD